MPVPDFSPGEVLTAADMNAVGLWLVASATITTATAASPFEVTAFSTNYDNYRVLINGADGSAVTSVKIQFGTTGGTAYFGSQYYDNYTGAVTGTDRANAAASTFCGIVGINDDTSVAFDVFQPFLARRTAIAGNYHGDAYSGWFGGVVANTTSYTSFRIFPATGTITGGSIRVYGYRN